jgi:multidrug efflux pump subunit AcrA (membrane-fusion protein)
MVRILKAALVASVACSTFLSGCRNQPVVTGSMQHSQIPAEVAHAAIGQLITYAELNATSAFQIKASIKTPSTGYIDKVLVYQGDIVSENQVLFEIRTKESMALDGKSLDSLKFNGTVEVKAASKGIVSALEHSQGDYVSEGDQLCQLAIPESFVFILEVPFELSHLIKINSTCTLVLPDSQLINGIIRSELPAMTGNSQAVKYIVNPASGKMLPENLSVKVRIVKDSLKDAVSLPKSSVLTNETMHDFWVMKLVNDSMAVKVPVRTGIISGDRVQIKEPLFSPADRFLTSGNYGLGDTAYIRILKSTLNGQ